MMEKEQKGDRDMDISLADLIKDNEIESESAIPDESDITKEINEFINTNTDDIISDYTLVPEGENEETFYKGFSSELLKSKTEGFMTLDTINLYDWSKKFLNYLGDVTLLNMKAAGVRTNEMLCVTVPTNSGKDVDGVPERRIEFVRNANIYNVFDIKPENIFFFTNGLFNITYKLGKRQYLISYGTKSGLINFYGVGFKGMIIPILKLEKLKKRDSDFTIQIISSDIITDEIMKTNCNIEMLIYSYKQLSKSADEIKTNEDVIRWFMMRKNLMIDLNHWMVIDDLIVSMFKFQE